MKQSDDMGSVSTKRDCLEAIFALKNQVEAALVGRVVLVERLLIALLTGGHVLIEGAPGLAKTRAVRLLAEGLDESFARIQCTPDLMPADITGTPVFQPDRGTFEFVAGPLFHSLILVDEINRAPPKVQSALLEAMAERQVTVAGISHSLPNPFMVAATQNPIEHEGTYPLPEAQIDRFMLHVMVDMPDKETERLILDLGEREASAAAPSVNRKLMRSDLNSAMAAVRSVHISAPLKDYIVRLVMATREQVVDKSAAKIAHPVSPRGSLALAAGARAKAFLAGRSYAVPEDVADLAVDVLSHRLVLDWRSIAEGHTQRSVIANLMKTVDPI